MLKQEKDISKPVFKEFTGQPGVIIMNKAFFNARCFFQIAYLYLPLSLIFLLPI